MPTGTCAICNKQKKVHRCKRTGKLLCNACYRRTEAHEECWRCLEPCPVTYRESDPSNPDGTGKPICPNCYRKYVNLGNCAYCRRRETRIEKRTDKGPMCTRCYSRRRNQEQQKPYVIHVPILPHKQETKPC